MRIGHSQWSPASEAMMAPTKQTVRSPIERRYRFCREAMSSFRLDAAEVMRTASGSR